MKNLHAEAPKTHAVGHLCGLLGRTKQAYYKTNEESLMRKLAQAELVTQYVKGIRRLDPGIGGVKLWHMYQKAFGQAIGRDRFMEILDTHGLKQRTAFDYDINSFIMVTVGDAGDTIRQLRFWHRNGKIRGCEGDGCCNTRTYDDQGHLHYVKDSKTGFSSIYTYIGDTLIEKKLFFHDTLQSVHTAIINGHKYPIRTIGKTDIHYSYEYDDYGSWTRKTSTSNDGKIGEILRRIEYY